jgi:hypothetical protein
LLLDCCRSLSLLLLSSGRCGNCGGGSGCRCTLLTSTRSCTCPLGTCTSPRFPKVTLLLT